MSKFKYRIRCRYLENRASYTWNKHKYYLFAWLNCKFLNSIFSFILYDGLRYRYGFTIEKYSYRKSDYIKPSKPWPIK